MLTMAMPVDVVDLAGGIVVCLLPVPASTMGFLPWLKNLCMYSGWH
jgi:hypothetical protein